MLAGSRVVLRSIRRDDLPRLNAFNNDVVVELAGGGDPPMPQSLERLQAEFDAGISSGGRDGTSFAIEVDAVLIGNCALFNFNQVARRAMLGITIGDQDYWGQGYGREATQLLVDYGFRHHNLHKIWLEVHACNQRAIRAYRACGFVEEGRLRQHVWSDGAYDDLVIMGILRDA
jgi:RimJ/RimL family protein N-acetyltransferase